MVDETLQCWQCGKQLDDIRLPLSRDAECRSCRAQLHVCRACQFYNPKLSDRCDQQLAERPRELARANFCDYFKFKPQAYQAHDSTAANVSKQKLNELFGQTDSPASTGESLSESDKAKQQLEALFGVKKDEPK